MAMATMTTVSRPATRPASSTSTSRLVLGALALLCIIAVVVRNRNQQQTKNYNQNTNGIRIRQTKQQSAMTSQTTTTTNALKNNNSRNMVGGYSNMDTDFLQSEDVLEIATFALGEHAAGSSNFGESALSSSLAVLPEEVESGAVVVKVLEAQRQVVAGLNYKLTLAILKDSVCLGAFKVTVYKPLPHMEQGLTVASWGNALECSQVADLMEAVREKEEETALAVEEKVEEERVEVEPDV